MNIWNRFGRLSLLLVGLCCLSVSALSAQSDATLGSAGELYRVRAGAYKDLFPGQVPRGVDPSSAALALDVERPGAPAQRYLVPTTAGNDVEILPSLIYEDAASTLYLIWEKRVNNIHPVLVLTGFSNGNFSAPIELISDSFSDKTHPQITLSRDQYSMKDASGNAVTRSRTVLHILWAQDDSTGVDTFYTPVIFEDGMYIGWNPVYRLNDLDDSAPASLAYPMSPRLLHSPVLLSGQDQRTVTVGFIAPVTQRLLTIELDALPAALSQIADLARGQIIDIGKISLFSRQALADRTRATILAAGASAFRAEVLQTIADKAWSYIVTSPSAASLSEVADGTRAQVIATGATFSGRGLRSFGDDAKTTIAEVRPQSSDGGNAPGPYPSQLFQLRLTSSRPAPNVGGTTGETRLFVSETGERTIASWVDVAGNRLLYRESTDGTWSDPREIRLSSGLSLEGAYAILDQRVRNH